ncbi:MAG TPA: peptide chain release factor 1 [Anaerolineae bacterium]|nr:peptide chain release factor 1 [Anaerolineae bacterium]HQK13307.1 peptide chain release factor 1 [Anaerolineae bacterium]
MDSEHMLARLDTVEARFEELTRLLADPDVAQDYEKVAEYAKERADLEETVNIYRRYKQAEAEHAAAEEMLEDTDEDIRLMAAEELTRLEAEMEALEKQLRQMLVPKDPRDERNVIVEIRAGAGGDEAGLFAADLLRMYTRYAERQAGWKTELISENRTGIGGYKEVVFAVQGKGAYSRLKYESGVHRVQRVPVTEASGRIHTSTVTVAVLPEVDDVEVVIDPKDLEIDTYGSSGPGGQHMQKNETAIRITHKPTGIVVTCESERSQTQNKMRAMSVLRARLYEMEQAKQDAEIDAARRSQVGTGERSEKIRTYNYPQNRVTDHRIGLNSYNLPAVMDGDLDDFIEALTLDEQTRRLTTMGI